MQHCINTRRESISILNQFYDKHIRHRSIQWSKRILPPTTSNAVYRSDPLIAHEVASATKMARALSSGIFLCLRDDRHWVTRSLVMCTSASNTQRGTDAQHHLITALYLQDGATVTVTISGDQYEIGPCFDNPNVEVLLEEEHRILNQCANMRKVAESDIDAASKARAPMSLYSNDESQDQMTVDGVSYHRYKPFAPFVPVVCMHRTVFRLVSEMPFIIESARLDDDIKNAFVNASVIQLEAICKSNRRVFIAPVVEKLECTGMSFSFAQLKANTDAIKLVYEDFERQEELHKDGIPFTIGDRKYVVCKSGRVYKQ